MHLAFFAKCENVEDGEIWINADKVEAVYRVQIPDEAGEPGVLSTREVTKVQMADHEWFFLDHMLEDVVGILHAAVEDEYYVKEHLYPTVWMRGPEAPGN